MKKRFYCWERKGCKEKCSECFGNPVGWNRDYDKPQKNIGDAYCTTATIQPH